MKPEDRYNSLFQFYGEKYAVSPCRLKAQAGAESNFDPDAKSHKGATGLSQFLQRTWEEWRDGTAGIQGAPDTLLLDPRDPEDAIRAQAAMMAWLLKQFNGDWQLALAAYNWGIGNLKKCLQEHGYSNWKSSLPIETQNYLARCETAYSRYAAEPRGL